MRLPFELPSKLQAFSAEFMSAFDTEADHALPESHHRGSLENNRDEPAAALTPSPEIQTRSIASAAAETAGLIASSFRALALAPSQRYLEMSNVNDNSHAADPAQVPSASSSYGSAADVSISCRDVQDSVDRELAAFGRSSASALLPAIVELLRHNYMRVSFALLLLGLLFLYLL